VSAAPPSTAPPAAAPEQAPAGEACPLCGAPLAAEQEWCLRCGAAARTRLAAAPGWKAPIVTVAVVAALALGVIAAALVKLAGDSGPAPAPVTRTLTTAPVAGATATTPALPGTGLPGSGTSTGVVPSTPATSTPTTTSPSVTGGSTISTAVKPLAPLNPSGKVQNTKAGKGRLRGLLSK